MFYINKKGIVIEAVQWDGSEKCAKRIEEIFKVQTEIKNAENWLYKDNLFWGRMLLSDYLFLNLMERLEIACKRQFEKCFTLIDDYRVALNVIETRDDLSKMWDNTESINTGLSGNTYA